eukprot:jgi/Bigna1/50151/estExt_Genewise1.C_670108
MEIDASSSSGSGVPPPDTGAAVSSASVNDTNNNSIPTSSTNPPSEGSSVQENKCAPCSSVTFKVKKWNAVALWSWDIVVETCAICRNHIMSPCIECQAKENATRDDCPIAWGVCNHAFHFHCISRWLQTRNVCPLGNREWEFQKHGSAGP